MITHPCIIKCVIGFAAMLTKISLPGILKDTITALSRCTTPVPMLVIGAILAGIHTRQLFSRDVLLFCFYLLIAFLMLVWGLMQLGGFDAALSA